jgi:lysozyme
MITTETPKKKTTRKPSPKKKGTPRKRKSVKGGGYRETPAWVRYLLSVVVSIAFVGVFFYFFIRPYMYRWKPCYGLKGYGVCMPYGFSVHGIDVSHYQGKVNWAELATAQQNEQFPLRFVFMKASEGGDLADEEFQANFDSAKAYGFVRGAYHFYNPKTDPVRQADFFIRSVHLYPGDLPPVLDIEKRGSDKRKLQRDLKVWLQRVERHYGVKPILYASYKFKTDYLNDSVFDSYPYWIAHYYVDSVEYRGDWKFWQHTDVGTLPGIKGNVDLNVLHGGMEELEQLMLKDSVKAESRK